MNNEYTQGVDVETIVDLIRNPLTDRQSAIGLLDSALKVSFGNGVISGSQQMAKIADECFARAGAGSALKTA